MKQGTITHQGKTVLKAKLHDDGKLEVKGEGKAKLHWDWILRNLTDYMFWLPNGTALALLPVRDDSFEEALRMTAALSTNRTGERYTYDQYADKEFETQVPEDEWETPRVVKPTSD